MGNEGQRREGVREGREAQGVRRGGRYLLFQDPALRHIPGEVRCCETRALVIGIKGAVSTLLHLGAAVYPPTPLEL